MTSGWGGCEGPGGGEGRIPHGCQGDDVDTDMQERQHEDDDQEAERRGRYTTALLFVIDTNGVKGKGFLS